MYTYLNMSISVLVCLFLLSACSDGVTDLENPVDPGVQAPTLVEVVASHEAEENLHLFDVTLDEISAGWTTFRFANSSSADHFFLLYEVPGEALTAADEADATILEHWFDGVTVPFQVQYTPYATGDITWGAFVDNLVADIGGKAPWFFDPGAPTMGGPGLTAPGFVSETTVDLGPGTYIFECYVKDADEEFHSFNGMIAQLTVTDERSEATAPEPTMEVTIAQPEAGGLTFDGNASSGEHTVAIRFEEQPEFGYEHLLGHNVQLVKLEDANDEALLEALALWLDWRQPGAFAFRAPEGAEFVGGAMEMPGEHTAYMHVDLSPGDYAWIAEVPAPVEKGMVQTFTVE